MDLKNKKLYILPPREILGMVYMYIYTARNITVTLLVSPLVDKYQYHPEMFCI